MVDVNALKQKLEDWLEKLQKDLEIYSYYAEIYNENGEIEGFQVFVPYEDIDLIESQYGNTLKELKVFLSPAVEGKILKIYLKKLANNFPIKVGEDIKNLSGTGFAIYLNWTNKAITVHKYENGSFKSKSCKKHLFWETDNGIWIVGFESCERVKAFISQVENFLDKHFGINYSVNYHRACGAYKECKKEA